MIRLRRWSVVCFIMVILTGFTAAVDQPPAVAMAGEERWSVDRAMSITPRGEPEPALKYRLLPLASELREGNAVPIYLRLNHEQNDAARKYWMETPLPWNDLPLDQVPLAEAHKYLDRMGRFLQQIDYGARRKAAEWNYTLDQADPISILLPDAQQMRGFTPMLVLRARVQTAERDYAAAARSLETGFSFSRHVAGGPFLINSLVGLAIAHRIADCIPDWVERPDAPNLYWSLTALPRPLIGLRDQMDLEQREIENQFPDLADLDRPRSATEWDAALKRFRTEARRIYPMLHLTEGLAANTPTPPAPPPPPSPPQPVERPLADPDEPASKSPDLAEARRFVANRTGKSTADVAAMPPAQVLILYIHGTFADRRDDLFKITYLPFPEARPRLAQWADRMKSVGQSEGDRLAKEFLPAVTNIMLAQVRLERKIALLRTIEALRLHAAGHGGQLPDSLDQDTAAPIPLDPGTGEPFEYRRDGATATLSSRLPGFPGLRYRVTVRGK